MEIDIRVQMILAERVNQHRKALWDVAVAQVLTHDGAVLRVAGLGPLGLGVIVTVPGAYLKHLPVDYLKIDGAFINDILNDPIDRAMVEAINKVAHLMGMQTIAECVENLDQLELLREIGVDYVQGYAISRPELFFIFADAPSSARHAKLMNA